MFKDYDKYLSTSLKVYILVLVLVFILKLVGMDYFGLDLDNPTLVSINNFCSKLKLDYENLLKRTMSGQVSTLFNLKCTID